jgi:hypothetical protein
MLVLPLAACVVDNTCMTRVARSVATSLSASASCMRAGLHTNARPHAPADTTSNSLPAELPHLPLDVTSSRLVLQFRASRCKQQTLCLQNFLIYRSASTFQLAGFFFIALFAFRPTKYENKRNASTDAYPEYFFLPALLLVFITVLNDGTMIAIGYDNAKASERPAKVRVAAPAQPCIELGCSAVRDTRIQSTTVFTNMRVLL